MKELYLVPEVSIDQLHSAEWNPVGRTESVNVRDLVESMKAVGFRKDRAITITSDYMIIDGHRRWTAARIAGMKTIPCWVDGASDPKKSYVLINSSTRPISSREWLQCYLAGGQAPSRMEQRIRRIIEACGEGMLWRLAQSNLSPISVLQVGATAIKYIGEDSRNNEWLNRAICWMVDGKRQWQVRAAISYAQKIPVEELRGAILEGRDIDLTKVQVAG